MFSHVLVEWFEDSMQRRGREKLDGVGGSGGVPMLISGKSMSNVNKRIDYPSRGRRDPRQEHAKVPLDLHSRIIAKRKEAADTLNNLNTSGLRTILALTRITPTRLHPPSPSL